MAASDFLPEDSDRSSDTTDLGQMGTEFAYQEELMSGTEEEYKKMEDAKKLKREAANRRKAEARREKERMEELEKQQREVRRALGVAPPRIHVPAAELLLSSGRGFTFLLHHLFDDMCLFHFKETSALLYAEHAGLHVGSLIADWACSLQGADLVRKHTIHSCLIYN